MINNTPHITVILDSQALVNLQHETFGLECLEKSAGRFRYKICVNDVSTAIFNALNNHKSSAKVVVSDTEGDNEGEIVCMDLNEKDYHLTIRPVPVKQGRKRS